MVAMRTAGVRELKNRLSEYLRLVRAGEEILITDRGEVVARLSPAEPSFESKYPLLEKMIREGRAVRGLPKRPGMYGPTEGPGITREDLQRLIDEEREDR
jgi:prevent-host-death family protein